jgi:subtilisin family serine protease
MNDMTLFKKVVSVCAVVIFIFSINVYAEYVPGEILVKYKDSTDGIGLSGIHSYIGAVKKKEFGKIRIQRLQLPDYMSVEDAIAYYEQDPNVEYAEPNYVVRIAATPNDPDFSSLWGLHNASTDIDIDAPEAWDETTGSTNVVIAVVDTGVAYLHPDFYHESDLSINNIWKNPGETDCNDGIDNDGNNYTDDCYGWDFLNDDNDPTDYKYDGAKNLDGHGTHVAGTIAAYGNNGTGVTGVMWRAKIMPLRFLGIDGSGVTSDAVEAILYANTNGAHIINNSWGSSGFSRTLKDAIDASSAVVVCAAGNEGNSLIGGNSDEFPFYPASFSSSNIISVAATDQSDNLASFSNYGAASVDLAAPGGGIRSTVPDIVASAAVTEYTEDFEGPFTDLSTFG